MPDDWKRTPRPPLPGLSIPKVIDDDLTPPPTDISSAVAALWPTRKLVEHVETLDSKIDLLCKDVALLVQTMNEFVKPAIKDQQGRVALLLEHHNQNLGRQERFWDESWPRLVAGVDDLTKRIARCERAQDRAEADIRALLDRTTQDNTETKNRLAAIEQTHAELDLRTRKLETASAAASAVEVALTKSQKRKLGGLAAAIGAAAGALTHLFR